jgi:hypothetical protein
MPSSGMLRCMALVRADVSEERSASIIRVTRIGELGTTIAVTSYCLEHVRRHVETWQAGRRAGGQAGRRASGTSVTAVSNRTAC